MRTSGLFQFCLKKLELRLIASLVEDPADELEAEINQIGVKRIRLAIVSNRLQISALLTAPHLIAAHSEFTGKPEQRSDLLQR